MTHVNNKNIANVLKRLFISLLCAAMIIMPADFSVYGKTLSSDAVHTVFFYTTDKNGDDVYISSATIDELAETEICHGNINTGENYYGSFVDAFPTTQYLEARGITLDEYVNYMAAKSSVSGAESIKFDTTNNSGDKFRFRPTDNISSYLSKSWSLMYSKTRYYFPDLFTYYSQENNYVPEEDLETVLNSKVEMPVFLAVESEAERIMNLGSEIAANGGEVTGCLAGSLDETDALRMVMPQVPSDLGDGTEQSAVSTMNGTTKWIYQTDVQYKENADSPITSLGTVAPAQCRLTLDGTTLKISFTCATEGAEIYHSLEMKDGSLYKSAVPQNKNTGTIEIENYDTSEPFTIYYRAVKEGYSDADVQSISSNDYELEENEEEPVFTYSLTSDASQYKAGESFNLSADIKTDESCSVYGLEYQLKVPTAFFNVDDVIVADGWQYGSAVVEGNKILTFITLNTDGQILATDAAVKFADIKMTSLTTGDTSIEIGDKTLTKADSSAYSNVRGEGLGITIESGGGSGGEVVDAWDGTSDITWYNRTDTVFHISTPEQLAGLAYIVNQGTTLQLEGEAAPLQETFTGKTFYLDNDIYLNDHKSSGIDSTAKIWQSIAGGDATNDNGAVFDGVFDGQNHTVYNMYFYSSAAWTQYEGRNRALFGITAEAAEIKNITVEDGYLNARRGVGAIVGKTGSLSGTYSPYRTGHGTLITNCHNVNTTIMTTDSKGVGGICGSAWNYPIISNCSNSGRISSTGAYPAGGIAGENEYIIKECVNTGTISSASNNAGGIVGSNKLAISEIDDCYNAGTITGNFAGGITGYQIGISKNCYNYGAVSGTYAGALFGELHSIGANDNNYYLDSISVGVGKLTSGTDSSTAKTADELKLLAETLGTCYAEDSKTVNSGYPILSWQSSTEDPEDPEKPGDSLEFIEGVDYNAAPDGYKVLIFKPVSTEAGIKYLYNGQEMYKSEKYEGYSYFVIDAVTDVEALALISKEAGENIVISYDGDINGNGKLNVADILMAGNLYSGKESYKDDATFSKVSMLERLRADCNGDGKVDVTDCRQILSIIMGQ